MPTRFSVAAALLLVASTALAGGPSKADLTRLARCKDRCRLLVPPVRSASPADAYVARALPARVRVETAAFLVEVPQGWGFTVGLTPGGGKLASIAVGPTGEPGDRTVLEVTALAGGPIPTLESLARLEPPSATGPGRVSHVEQNHQEWFIKEYSALIGGVEQRGWLAYANRKGITYAVTARATVDHAALVAQVLSSLTLR